MTPAVIAAKKAGIAFSLHEYSHESSAESYGREAAEKLGQDESRVFKTLIVQLDDRLATAILPVSRMLNLKQMAKASGSKKASMANPDAAQRSTGYVLGGVSPLGQKKRLTTVIDSTAETFSSVYVSGGKRGLEIELSAADLQMLTAAEFADITSD